MKLSEKQFDELEFSELFFFHSMLVAGQEETEKNEMRHAAFITWSLGAAGEKSYEAYLSALGILRPKNYMNKDVKKRIAKDAQVNADKIFDLLRKKKKKHA